MPATTNILMEIPFLLVVVCMLTTIFSNIGCGYMRHVSFKTSTCMDIPNQRSMHEQPMPRAGGGPMALFSILALTFLWLVRPHLMPFNWFLTICIGGSLIDHS